VFGHTRSAHKGGWGKARKQWRRPPGATRRRQQRMLLRVHYSPPKNKGKRPKNNEGMQKKRAYKGRDTNNAAEQKGGFGPGLRGKKGRVLFGARPRKNFSQHANAPRAAPLFFRWQTAGRPMCNRGLKRGGVGWWEGLGELTQWAAIKGSGSVCVAAMQETGRAGRCCGRAQRPGGWGGAFCPLRGVLWGFKRFARAQSRGWASSIG
jgi:hypothetical protein